MGLNRAQISMSQPANVVYTHKKFKRTSSSSSQPPWAATGGGGGGGGGGAADDQPSPLSGGANNGGAAEHHGVAMGGEAAYTRQRTLPEARVEAPSIVGMESPSLGSMRRPTNGLCDSFTKARQMVDGLNAQHDGLNAQHDGSGARLRCSYCQVICDNERNLHEHVLSHLLPAAACIRCGSKDNPCSCKVSLKSQLFHFPSSDIHNPSVNFNRNSPVNCSFADKYPQPADLSLHSTNHSNNHAYPTTASQLGDHPSSNASSEGAALKSIYKPKFRASYSLDESSLSESSVSGLFATRISEALTDSSRSSDSTRSNASSTYQPNISNCSSHSAKKSGVAGRTGPTVSVATSSGKQEDIGPARGLGGLVGAGLWKDIKSPSPDIGEHIDKIIVQNQVIMDSENPLLTRKYRRQSSIGSSSSESDGSSGPRNRRSSVTDSSGKSKPPSSLQLGLLSHQNRFRNALQSDGTPAPPPSMHPTDLLTASTSVNTLKRSLSSAGLPAPVTPHYRPAAPFLPSAALLDAHKRGLPTDVLAALTPAAGATEHDLLRQHLLSMPDSEANKILLARGHALALQGTSIVPVTNAAALQLVCPNCSASFRNRECLQLHIERHCDAVIRTQSSQVNYSYRVRVADQQARTVITKPDSEQQEVALDLIKKVHAASDDPHTYLRGTSLGAEVRLNPDQDRFNSQHVRFHKSMSPFTRQSSLEPAIPPNKKRRLSSDPPGGDISVKSVHPVFLQNGIVFQKANVSVKNINEIKKTVGKNQMYGGEVKICDGVEYKTIKIDTSEGSRSLALDMCLTAPSQDTRTPRLESPVPTSLVVTLSKSGLICGGTVVESRVCMSKAAPTNLVYSRSSSDHGPLDGAAAASHPCDDVHRMSRDASEGIISSLQRYAPQLQLPNLSIPGVPIPNITGVMLPKLITNQSGMQTSRLLSGGDNQTTTAFCLDSSSSLPTKERTPSTDHVTPSIISLSKAKLVPYVPGIPGPYSQASSNMMHVNASLTKGSSPVVLSPSPVLLTSAARKPTAFPQPVDTPHQARQSPAHRIDCTPSEKPLSSSSSSITFGHSVPEQKSSPDVPPVVSAVPIALEKRPPKQAATEVTIIPVPNVLPDVALSLAAAPKEMFLMPRKRPDTLPLKPHQFTPKSSALLVGSTIMSPDTPRPKKSCAQLLLNGSAYTYLGLKVSTKTYYCCIHRPQPMYVPHTPDSKISMYSNWERKPAAENPFNLSISESMGLYTSGSCTDRAYTVAKPKTLDYTITCSDDKLKVAMEHLKIKEKLAVESSLTTDETSSSPPENSTVKSEVNSCKEAVCSGSNTAGSTTTGSSKDASSGRTTKRIKIFDGGFKSTEEYTYVRGRGRGRYVCETCGIRCKKPSMLKKHIRSHTNLRPYPCHHCTSRFKTKGNLTKHLKSKAHYKRCMQLGVPPDPPPSSHDDAMDCDEDDGDDEDDDDDDDVDDDDDEDDDECDDDIRDSSSRERSRARSDSREPRRHDTRESSRESSADEMPGSSSSSSCSSSSERAAEQSYPAAVDVLAPTPGLPLSTVLEHDDVLSTPVDLSTSHKSPASSASADDSPMDLSVKKEVLHVPSPAARGSSVTCTFTSLAMVSRPSFLPLIPAPRAPNLPSPLSLRSPMTPIREQPADILSPVTESSMLLKSIYNTTERATKATTALHIGSHHSQGWLNREKSGVMMTAYLTERAIQDTFIKRHQYQGAISNSSAFAVKDDMDSDPPATLSTATAPRYSLLNASSVSTGLPGMTSTLSDSKSMQFQTINSDQIVQSPGSLKLKKYYCGKWENSEAPASSPVVANVTTSNGSSLTTVLSSTQLLKLPQSTMVNLSSTSLSSLKVEPKDEPVKGAVNIHNNSGLTIVQVNSSTIPKGIILLPSDSNFLPSSIMVPGIVPASDPPLAENKIIPAVPTHKLKNNKNINNSVAKYSFEPSTQGVNMIPNAAMLPVTSATVSEALTRPIPKMTLIKTPSGTIIAVSSVQSHTAQSLKQSASPSLGSGSHCRMDEDLPNRPGSDDTSCLPPVTSQHTIAPANALSASLQSCITRMNVSCATSTASMNNRTSKATTTSTVSAVYFSTPASTCSSSITKSHYTSNSTTLPALTQTSDSLKNAVFVAPTSASSVVLANTGTSSYSLSNLSATTMTVSSSSLASVNLLSNAPVKKLPVVTMATCLSASSPGPSAASRSSVVTTAPSSAVNLTVLNRGDAKNGASFLSPSGVVPSSSSNRPAPEDGRCRCCVCHKEFARSSQLTLHMNIHYMERPFRCVTCAVSFRTSGHLQKHKRSASHFNKVNMNLTFGAASTANPRPFKCHDCKVAFRIHGHLAKHLRSKMHILKLECLGKLPFGVYAEMERTGLTLANIDTSDCENSLISLQALANQLFAKEPGKLLAWQNGTAEPPPSPSEGSEDPDQPSRTRTISNSSTNSDDYPLADDQDDPPAGDSGDEGLCSPSATSRPATEVTPPPTPSSLTPRRSSSSPAAPSPLVCSNTTTNNNIYKPMMVPQPVLVNQSLSCAPTHTFSSLSSTASSSDHHLSTPSSGPLQPSIGISCTSTVASRATSPPSSTAFSSSSPLAVSRALVTPTSSAYFIPSGPCVLATSFARSTSSAHLLTVSSVRRGRQASAVVTSTSGVTIASLVAGAEDAPPSLPPR